MCRPKGDMNDYYPKTAKKSFRAESSCVKFQSLLQGEPF